MLPDVNLDINNNKISKRPNKPNAVCSLKKLQILYNLNFDSKSVLLKTLKVSNLSQIIYSKNI